MHLKNLPSDEATGMYAEERRQRILDLLKAAGKVSVQNLTQLLKVTGATIRADLRALEVTGALMRTHGGAMIPSKTLRDAESQARGVVNLAEKRQIAKAAFECIKDGDTIVLDMGSTTMELARLIGQRNRLTVVTNDFLIAQLLEKVDTVETILLGGIVRKGFNCTINIGMMEVLGDLSVDKAFMTTTSFSVLKGATTPDIQQANAKKAMMAMCSKVYLLCDSSKLGKVSFAQFARPSEIQTLITDWMDPGESRQLEKLGMDVIVAGTKPSELVN